MYVVLIYDISCDEKGAYVTRNVFKTCKKYLNHVQKSVFEGEVTDAQLFRLRTELGRYLREKVDSVILFKGRNQKWMEKEFWTEEVDVTGNIL